MSQEEEYVRCDRCFEHFPAEELEECPSSWHEVKHGITIGHQFCSDCCVEVFQNEGCQSDVGNCDRATKLMAEHLKNYAEKKGFSSYEGKEHVYLDAFKAFCLADFSVSPEEIFEDEASLLPDELEFFEGKETFMVKQVDKKFSFSKVLVSEVLEAFEDLGCYKDRFYFLNKRHVLVVTSDGMWGALAPRTEEAFDVERSRFIEETRYGHKFFELGKEDGFVLVDTKMMEFDWSKLTDQKFVELCCDIVKSLPQVAKVRITEGTSDLGQDIEAIEVISSLVGKIKQKLTIQCKHFLARKVASSDIAQLPNSYSQLKFDVFWLMTDNYLLPSCHRMLDAWDKDDDLPFKVVRWDRKKIEDYLRNQAEIYTRYFG
ncbi:hypothetical protein GTO27_13445 [Candidatus Bathyarchaeota archaeon]|nr:hypothetical protein [Candidatus Bathyarchaeota archaeon]